MIILFDGVCNLCNSWVRFVIERDPRRRFRFATLQSAAGRRALAEHGVPQGPLDTMYLLSGSRVHRRSGAALRILRHLSGLWPLLALFWIVPWPVRDLVYGFVAKRRYRWFGKSETCMVPTPELLERFLPDPAEAASDPKP